jgi:hypothetical protein
MQYVYFNFAKNTLTCIITFGQILCPYLLKSYSLRFKTKVTFGHNLRYETKGMFGEISLKLPQSNWNVARNNLNVVDELPSQSSNNLHLFNDLYLNST